MRALTIVLLWFFVAQVLATASVPSLNDCPDMVFIDGNENESMPSNGSGGAYPGLATRTINTNNTFYYPNPDIETRNRV